MMKWVVLLAVVTVAAQPAFARESDARARPRIIREAINSYPGNCRCPYNTDRAGRSCGGRSAYSRPGGYAPKCYPSDVKQPELEAYRRGE